MPSGRRNPHAPLRVGNLDTQAPHHGYARAPPAGSITRTRSTAWAVVGAAKSRLKNPRWETELSHGDHRLRQCSVSKSQIKSGGNERFASGRNAMKTLGFALLVLPLLLLAPTRQAAAGPATVEMYPEDGVCAVAWHGLDQNGILRGVQIDGKGVSTITNNARDNRAVHCDGHIALGEVALVYVNAFMDYAPVRLLTIQEMCGVYPDACHGAGDQGAVIFNAQNRPGFRCSIGGAIANQVITHNFTEVVAPSGQAQIVCHVPE
jgi:hypothetical protein